MTPFLRRLHYLLNRRRIDRELADEMAQHREMTSATFGNTLRLREQSREAWGWMWLESLGQDLRYAVRMLRRSPVFTICAVVMLALGMGVNIAAFGFFNFMMLKPLPVKDADAWHRFERQAPGHFSSDLPYAEMAFVREHSRSLSAVLALHAARLPMDGSASRVRASFVTSNFFAELGAAPLTGRVLEPSRDDAPGANLVAMLGESFWERQFGRDPSVVGRAIVLNGKQATVVGIVPKSFSGLTFNRSDVWAPIEQEPRFVDGSLLLTDLQPDGPGVRMWGRLRGGVTPLATENELRSIVAELHRQNAAGIWENESLTSKPAADLHSMQGGSERWTGTAPPAENKPYVLIALGGALALLTLGAACANLGSLLLARSVSRQDEIGIRVAIGAGRARLVRQFLTESLLLASIGGCAGLGVGVAVLHALMTMSEAPDWLTATPDWRIAVFAVGIGVLSTVLFGLVPALQLARPRQRATTMRQILIAVQIAASCVLLIVAGLLTRAMSGAIAPNRGFSYEQVVSIDPSLAAYGYTPERARAYLDELQRRLRAVSGVTSVSMSSSQPFGRRKTKIHVEEGARQLDIYVSHVDPPFFDTMTIALVRGRTFERAETGAVIVSDSLARIQWPNQDPVGRPFVDRTVVGVVAGARLTALQDPDAIEAYFPVESDALTSMVVLAKTSAPPDSLARDAQGIARTIDSHVAVETQTLTSAFAATLKDTEQGALATSALGITALLLACSGIVGLVALAVSQRTKEIGIRIALGARPAQVFSAILRQFYWPLAAGLVFGVLGAAALSQLLRRELYGISALDPVAYLAAIALFTVTVALAVIAPVRRALGINPLKALRHQ